MQLKHKHFSDLRIHVQSCDYSSLCSWYSRSKWILPSPFLLPVPSSPFPPFPLPGVWWQSPRVFFEIKYTVCCILVQYSDKLVALHKSAVFMNKNYAIMLWTYFKGSITIMNISWVGAAFYIGCFPNISNGTAIAAPAVYKVAQKTGPPSHCKYSEIPWPNCVEIGELLQYYMLNTVINFLFQISSCCGAT